MVLSWGLLLLPHMPMTLEIDNKLQALAIRIQKTKKELITQEEYNVMIVDVELKKGMLERELQLVGDSSMEKYKKG
jgi:hypothetical protein